ncbi:hypothetical protein HDV00_007615 [Rhizophlyctis rosea]|nr:hypothetical protein HDV00_007615 [Rhizophlyctis rosea]
MTVLFASQRTTATAMLDWKVYRLRTYVDTLAPYLHITAYSICASPLPPCPTPLPRPPQPLPHPTFEKPFPSYTKEQAPDSSGYIAKVVTPSRRDSGRDFCGLCRSLEKGEICL